MNVTGKKIALLGAGKSGLSAARLAARHGALPHVFDTSDRQPEEWPGDILLTTGATEEQGRQFGADIVVISPGMEADCPFVLSFAETAEELIGEIEFAYRFYTGKIIGITGTNGKTTTTELIERILLKAGKTVRACGNYGVPFSEIAGLEPQPEWVSLELSSFQLETIRNFHADVAIWLNFAPDHMDRYSKIEDYKAAKLRIFENQTSADCAVIREGEDLPAPCARTLSFSSESENTDLFYKNHGIHDHSGEVLSLLGTKMDIKHNAENVMASLLASRSIGIPLKAVRDALLEFAPPLHRCELIRILDGVEYLNDSKATNLHALEAALRSQTHPVILIAGGKDKGLEYDSLIPLLKEKVKQIVAFGQIRDQLFDTFHTAVPTEKSGTLEETILKARSFAEKGDIVLFSPGTSSFDMFAGYEQRGDAFRNIVLSFKI